MNKLIIKFCFAVPLLLQSTLCIAACKSIAGYAQFPQMPLLTGSISLGEDAPVGTVLYRQTFTPSGTYTYTCDTPTDIEILYTTTGTKSSYSGSFPFKDVIETGYAGIGYALWNARRGISYGSISNSQIYPIASNVTSATLEKDDLQVEFALIKTGNISAGVFDASSLTALLVVMASSNVDTALGLYFTGSLTITLPTCTTPDYTVNLGKWGQARFNGKGSASAWVDSAIRLSGCGQFKGNLPITPEVLTSGAITGIILPLHPSRTAGLSPFHLSTALLMPTTASFQRTLQQPMLHKGSGSSSVRDCLTAQEPTL